MTRRNGSTAVSRSQPSKLSRSTVSLSPDEAESRHSREVAEAERRGRAQAAAIHAEVRTWRCLLWCRGPLIPHRQWFWCSPSCRETLKQERGRNDTPTDTGALLRHGPEASPGE
jgi:hypothetical protein